MGKVADEVKAAVREFLAENGCPLCAFVLVFVTCLPVDAYVFTTASLSLCELYDVQVARGVLAPVVAFLSVIGVLYMGGAASRLWGWRRCPGKMAPIWRQNLKKALMPIGDIPLKRKITICLCLLYIMLRVLCLVVCVMPASGMIASEVWEKVSDIKYGIILHYLSPSCVITLFGVGTVLFYLAVQVPQSPASKKKG